MQRRDFIRTSALALGGMPGAIRSALTTQIQNTVRPALNVSVSLAAAGKPLNHYWSNCVGAGRANEGLRGDWQEQLRLCAAECGFRYLRFHGLFHDDMFVYREEYGKAIYNWQYIDDLFDHMLERGVRPFVELSFFPKEIGVDKEGGTFWWKAHVTPPKDFGKWKELIEHFVHHCLARYGENEVRSWYFEVWNEPNLSGFWNATQQRYFEFYGVTARAIKGVDPKLRVGGPATSSYHPSEEVDKRLQAKSSISAGDYAGIEHRGPWIEDFLRYCESANLPLDFVSSHPYPTNFPIDSAGNHLEVSRPVNSTQEDILWLRKTMAKSRYPDAEIHLTEWSSSPSPRDHTHDYLQAATYIVKVALDCIGLAQSLSYWTFTDIFEEGGAGDTIFHGGFGLVNFQGIVKPSFHAYRLLNRLGDEELHREDGGIITKRSRDSSLAALLYNYPPEVLAAAPLSKGSRDVAERTLATGSKREAMVRVTDLRPGSSFVVETLNAEHGFALRSWQAIGSPEPPSREQTALLRQHAMGTAKQTIRADKSGVLGWSGTLSPWAVVAIYQE